MEKNKNTLSVVIITKNEEREVLDCIKALTFANEVVVVDSESTDQTVKLAKQVGAKVITHRFADFATQRNEGLKRATGNWILYIDADERVSPELAREIELAVNVETFDVYEIKRQNFYFKKYAWPKIEKMQRLFKKSALSEWHGRVHESPLITSSKIGLLNHPLLHYTHKDLASMVDKTNKWSEIESELLINANHPNMKEWRFIRIMLTKFYESYISQEGWKVGTTGFIESIYQAYSYFIVYAKLWERQKNKTNKN